MANSKKTFGARCKYLFYLLKRNPLSIVGIVILLILILSALCAPLLTSHDPKLASISEQLQPPSALHPFGTDNTGKDIFARVLYGGRYDLVIAFGSVIVSLLLGLPLGAWLGYVGGWVDEFIMRILDSVQAFPSFVLAMIILYTVGPNIFSLIFVIGFVNFPSFTRLVRAEMLSRKESQYVEAARCLGYPMGRVIFRHLLPNCLSPVINQAALAAGWSIITTAGLGFIGLGIAIPNPEWGSMISEGAKYVLSGQWWISFFPGVAIALTVLAFNLIGDAVDDIVDPKRR